MAIDNRHICIQVKNLQMELQEKKLFEKLSFRVYEGEFALIVGRTGVGKTTLLKIINGLLVPKQGYVDVLGSRIPGRSAVEARTVWMKTGTVLQELALFENYNVIDNVKLALKHSKIDTKQAVSMCLDWLNILGFPRNKCNNLPRELSGGERQRVAIARAMVHGPKLLIMDEPFSSQDSHHGKIIMNVFRSYVERGNSLIMSSHHFTESLGKECNKVIELKNDGLIISERQSE